MRNVRIRIAQAHHKNLDGLLHSCNDSSCLTPIALRILARIIVQGKKQLLGLMGVSPCTNVLTNAGLGASISLSVQDFKNPMSGVLLLSEKPLILLQHFFNTELIRPKDNGRARLRHPSHDGKHRALWRANRPVSSSEDR